MVKSARYLVVLLVVLLLVSGVAQAHPGTVPGIYVLDSRAGQTLVMVLPSLELATQSSTGQTDLGVSALSARFLPDGQIVFVDLALALRRIGPRGPQDWLPPGSANAPLFLSPDGQTLAYLKPIDLPPGENEPATNGVAVLDLATGAERVLFHVPDVTVRLYGWVGKQLLVEVPNWSPVTRAPAAKLVLGLLNTDAPQAAPQALASLPGLLPGSHYAQTSLDQHYLAYQSTSGLVVAAIANGRYGFFGQAADPMWTETGLTGLLDGQRANLSWSEAALSQSSPASGPVALPATTTSLPVGPSQSRPTAPSAILLYRPVKSSTPVSAYMDLDFSVGSISDWTGWTGTHWAWGHAYDQHKGTDYAGSLGDPVYASAPGTVDQVVIDCVNTYPGGPGSFGSYVRIDHGVQSDGFSYKTLYGHFKCDAVYRNVGDVITTLPTQLAQMGNTGWSTGVHTHLQVYRNGITIDPYSSNIISDNPPISTIGDLDGMVRDADGQPAPGVTVKIVSGGLLQTAVTGDDGHYHFTGVRVGATTPTAVRGVRWGVAAVNVVAAQTISAPDITLDQCGGTTVPADGCPAITYDAADYLTDVTVPDSGVVLPSQPLTKTWRLGNTGSSTWGAGYQLVFVGGTTLQGAPGAVDLPSTPPNATLDLTANFSAPAEAGVHRAYWRLRNPGGTYIGPLIWVELDIQPAGTGITVFTADPPSPSGSNLVHLHALADGVPNFRALRLLIDGSVVTTTTALELNYDWQTTGLDPVEHSLVVEAANQADTNWTQPQRRGINYGLQAPTGPANLASDRPSPTSPADGFSSRASVLQVCAQSRAPEGQAIQYLFVISSTAGSADSSWVNTSCYDFAHLDPGDYTWWAIIRDLQGSESAPSAPRHANLMASTQGLDAASAAPNCSVQSLPAISNTSPVSVTWASPTGAAFDVQYLDSGRGAWRDWLRAVASTSALFKGQLGHRYSFRCRAADPAGNQGSYPGTADTATLLGAQTGQPDLRVLNLTVVPNPSGGVLAQVTIWNNSTADTQRGFYVDLYEDHLPSGVGDFTGSVQAWPNAPIPAGATVTLSAVVPQGSGQHTALLYAQVDSTGAVDESDEGNNVWTSGTGACVAAPDAYENDNTLSSAKLLSTGSSQVHSFGGPGDRDWMLLEAQPGHMYQFNTSDLAPGVDTRLTIYGPDGASPMISNDDADGTTLASQLTWTPPAPGPYYLVAADWNPGFGGCGASYTVSAQDLGPGNVTFLPSITR